MALTLIQATADVRQLLNEPAAVYWTDTELEDWIKEGTRLISAKTLQVEETADITLVQNQLIYNLADGVTTWAADCLEPYAAIYNNGSNKYKGLQLVHPKQIGNLMTFTSGDPKYYSFHNRSFYIWPLPSATTATRTVSILYAKESEDVTELSDEHQHLAIIWAQARAMEKDHKYGTAQSLKQQFFSELDFTRKDKTSRAGENSTSVKSGQPTTQ
jgi:hypothetical protein